MTINRVGVLKYYAHLKYAAGTVYQSEEIQQKQRVSYAGKISSLASSCFNRVNLIGTRTGGVALWEHRVSRIYGGVRKAYYKINDRL